MKLVNNDLEMLLLQVLKCSDGQDTDSMVESFKKFKAGELQNIAEDNLLDLTIAYSLINSNFVDDEEKKQWQKIYDSYLITENLQWEQLEKVVKELHSIGHEILLLKDMGLSLNIYPTRCYRRHVDIDILVLNNTYVEIDSVLEALGFDVGFDDNYNRSYNYMANIFGQKKGTMYINGDKLELEFHLRPHAGRWIRPKQEPNPVVLFDNSIKVKLKEGLTVRVLAHNDNLVYECIHANKHFLVLDRIIRNYMDIDRIIATGKIDWHNVTSIAHRYEVVLPVKMALMITKELFQSEIPDYVFNELVVPRWRENYFKRWVDKYSVFDYTPQKSINQIDRFLFFLLMADSWINTLIIIIRIFFMPIEHLKARYQFSNNLLVPYYYIYNMIMIIWKKRL